MNQIKSKASWDNSLSTAKGCREFVQREMSMEGNPLAGNLSKNARGPESPGLKMFCGWEVMKGGCLLCPCFYTELVYTAGKILLA